MVDHVVSSENEKGWVRGLRPDNRIRSDFAEYLDWKPECSEYDEITRNCSSLGRQFGHLYRNLLKYGHPLACEFDDDAENVYRRPNRGKLRSKFKTNLHVSLCQFQQFCLISSHVCCG